VALAGITYGGESLITILAQLKTVIDDARPDISTP
jgi:hypothetical protein